MTGAGSDDGFGEQEQDGPDEEGPDGALYPMRLVTRLTGLSADTIRAWERRHQAIRPSRTQGNTRRFSPEEVRRLSLLREATDRGHAIGTIAPLSIAELEVLVSAQPSSARSALGDASDGLDDLRRAYLFSVARFDSRAAYDLLLRAATFLRPEDLVFGLMLPVLREVGVRWSHGELGVAQEHLVSAQFTAVLNTFIRLRPPPVGAAQVLVTTPPGHRHEFGALVAALLVASRGLDPLYLGTDLPFEEIEWATRASRASLVVLSLVRDPEPGELADTARWLERLVAAVPVWCGLKARHPLAGRVPGVRYFHEFEVFQRALEGFKPG